MKSSCNSGNTKDRFRLDRTSSIRLDTRTDSTKKSARPASNRASILQSPVPFTSSGTRSSARRLCPIGLNTSEVDTDLYATDERLDDEEVASTLAGAGPDTGDLYESTDDVLQDLIGLVLDLVESIHALREATVCLTDRLGAQLPSGGGAAARCVLGVPPPKSKSFS